MEKKITKIFPAKEDEVTYKWCEEIKKKPLKLKRLLGSMQQRRYHVVEIYEDDDKIAVIRKIQAPNFINGNFFIKTNTKTGFTLLKSGSISKKLRIWNGTSGEDFKYLIKYYIDHFKLDNICNLYFNDDLTYIKLSNGCWAHILCNKLETIDSVYEYYLKHSLKGVLNYRNISIKGFKVYAKAWNDPHTLYKSLCRIYDPEFTINSLENWDTSALTIHHNDLMGVFSNSNFKECLKSLKHFHFTEPAWLNYKLHVDPNQTIYNLESDGNQIDEISDNEKRNSCILRLSQVYGKGFNISKDNFSLEVKDSELSEWQKFLFPEPDRDLPF